MSTNKSIFTNFTNSPTKLLSDAEFLLDFQDGNVKRILAHRNILAASSAVFRAMFCGDLKKTGLIKITDVFAESFDEFVQLFYGGSVQLTVDNTVEVLKLIDKYDAAECFQMTASSK